MFIKSILILSVSILTSLALNCKHKVTDKQRLLVMGNYQGPVEIPIDIGSYTCETGLDRCGTFGPTDVAEFMKLQGGRILTPLWLFGTNGTVEGTTCMSQTDCQTLKAIQGDKGCKTKQNCCCSTDDCADYNNSSFSMPLLTSLMMMLAIVMMKH